MRTRRSSATRTADVTYQQMMRRYDRAAHARSRASGYIRAAKSVRARANAKRHAELLDGKIGKIGRKRTRLYHKAHPEVRVLFIWLPGEPEPALFGEERHAPFYDTMVRR